MAYSPDKHLAGRKTKQVTLHAEGEDIVVTVLVNSKGEPALPWSLKNQLVTSHLHWDEKGKTYFDADGYMRDVLKKLVVDAPWGPTTDVFLSQVGDELGSALEQLVPKAFAPKTSSISIEEVKKE